AGPGRDGLGRPRGWRPRPPDLPRLGPGGPPARRAEARVDPAGVELVHLGAYLGGQAERVDVAAGVVEVVAGLRVDAAHRPDHLRAEQDAVRVDDREQQV